jgi:GH24 family phage-related lysozyme (muramidase)
MGCASAGDSAFPSRRTLAPGLLREELSADGRRAAGPVSTKDVRPVHNKGLELTKVSEGWVPRLYNDAAGYCTIGYGHLLMKARCTGSEPPIYRPSITKAFGTELLKGDMAGAQIAVAQHVKAPINDTQYSALVDFVFNVGAANFRNSTLLKKVNAGDFNAVPVQFRRWTLAGGKSYPGLVTRREREIDLFFDGMTIPRTPPGGEETVVPVDIEIGEPVG